MAWMVGAEGGELCTRRGVLEVSFLKERHRLQVP